MDTNFSSRILLSTPPPKVIHVRLGNLDMRGFQEAIARCCTEVLVMNGTHKLVHADRIEGVR